jgi:predicted 2-oxoglutarate/Fe(II)-dependent dioxygenase YbiX
MLLFHDQYQTSHHLTTSFWTTGLKIQSLSNGEVELIQQYDSASNPDADCGIDKANANRSCTIQFVIPKNITPPILVHYQIENFYQNHRKYIKSRDVNQVGFFEAKLLEKYIIFLLL